MSNTDSAKIAGLGCRLNYYSINRRFHQLKIDVASPLSSSFSSSSSSSFSVISKIIIIINATGVSHLSSLLLASTYSWRCPGEGGGYSTIVYTGRLRPEVQPLTLLYTILHDIFLLLTNGTPFTTCLAQNPSVSPFGPFHRPKWPISLHFYILQLVKFLPFHIPEAWIRYPFQQEGILYAHASIWAVEVP